MTVRRILPYASGAEMEASREFYVDVLGLEVGMEDPVLACSAYGQSSPGLQAPDNPTAQLVIPPPGMEDPQPAFGIDVGEPAAVDAAHAEAVRRGLRIVYELRDEPWRVRRFFVEDPSGTIINVLAHMD